MVKTCEFVLLQTRGWRLRLTLLLSRQAFKVGMFLDFGVNLLITKSFLLPQWYFTGCCTLLFYDYALTWFDEVEYAWNGKKGAGTYIYLKSRSYKLRSLSVFYLFLMVRAM